MNKTLLFAATFFLTVGCSVCRHYNNKDLTIVYDKISNHTHYTQLDYKLQTALNYLDTVDPNTACGTYFIVPAIKSTVSEYETKENNAAGYEAHRHYIDVQYIVKGEEKIVVSNVKGLQEKKPYNSKNDCIRYEESGSHPVDLKLKEGMFVILYPNDAHIPGLTLRKQQKVKKIVVKVPVD